MKNRVVFFMTLMMMVWASCSDHSDNHTNQSDAADSALELYYKYADNESLTVAYIGDFELDGNKIDALMIQASFDEDWDRLKNEFGMDSEPDSLSDVSMGMEINADFIRELGLDTITDLSQVDSARFNQLTEIIASKISDIVNNLSVSDTDLPDMDEYISSLANEVANQLLNEVVEGHATLDTTRMDAGDYGHHGYVSAADNSKRTIWLFFYDNQEECNMILTHIKEDIVVQQYEQKRG